MAWHQQLNKAHQDLRLCFATQKRSKKTSTNYRKGKEENKICWYCT